MGYSEVPKGRGVHHDGRALRGSIEQEKSGDRTLPRAVTARLRVSQSCSLGCSDTRSLLDPHGEVEAERTRCGGLIESPEGRGCLEDDVGVI